MFSLSDSECDEAIDENLKRAYDIVKAFDNWGYGTTLQYHCGLAKGFETEGSTEVMDYQEMTCQWNETWGPTGVLGTCVCKL